MPYATALLLNDAICNVLRNDRVVIRWFGYFAGLVRLSLKSRTVWSYMMTQQSIRGMIERLSTVKRT